MLGFVYIFRPHGQHAMVLAEDAVKYVLDSGNEKTEATQNPANQIYLTFPADSLFTEADVHAYFRYIWLNLLFYL